MNILLAAATEAEIAPFKAYVLANWQQVSAWEYKLGDDYLHICITGVGMVATTYSLTKSFAQRGYDVAIQTGIAGSFNRDIGIGDLVQVTSDQFGDIGAEDHDNYLNIFDMGFADGNNHPYANMQLVTPPSALTSAINLPMATSITVNMVTGKQTSVDRLMQTYGAGIESMEGAAFHYVCLMEGITFAQVRAISNYIEPRDRSKWDIKTAVINLNNWLVTFIGGGLHGIE